MKWLWKAWQGNRLQATLNALIGLTGAAISLAQVWAVHRAIDVASGDVEGSIYWAVALMAGLILARFALSISSTWIHNILGIRAQNQMQQQMLDRILRSEWMGKQSRHSGDMLNRLELDVGSVVHFLTEVIPSALSTLALFAGAFYYMYQMDNHIALVIVVLVPIFVGMSRIYIPKMRELTREVRDSDSKVQSVLQETIQNRILIKTLESDDMMVGRLEDTQSELRHKVVKRTAFRVVSGFIVNFGFSLGYLIAFLWSALRLSDGTLTFGGMTAFLQLVNRIQNPAHSLMQLVPHFVSVFTAAERLMELEEDPIEEQGAPIYMKTPCGIRLENVSYAYPNSHDQAATLDNLTFDFKPGTCTAILGQTGAGKTTLIRLILSLLKPQKGHIQVYNKKNKRDMSPRLRCNFVYVPQGNTLLSGTIRENLRLGSISATDQDMYNALHLACADFVKEFPEGLDTVCTEKGGGLSEGQAQRIAIARALLRNRPIMLFDEATSALDPETERKLLENILGQRNRTVLFITHRPAVVDYCDQVMRI